MCDETPRKSIRVVLDGSVLTGGELRAEGLQVLEEPVVLGAVSPEIGVGVEPHQELFSEEVGARELLEPIEDLEGGRGVAGLDVLHELVQKVQLEGVLLVHLPVPRDEAVASVGWCHVAMLLRQF